MVGISRAEKQIEIASGGNLSYDSLVLAVGASNRRLPIPGGDLDGVLYLRSLAEAIFIKKRIEEAQRIAVIGGGFIGLELAAVASALGKNVTVIEALPRVMARVVAPIISEFFRELHASRGVKILCGATVTEIRGADGRVTEVVVSDGSICAADLVLVGIGVTPNIELAHDAGLAISNGIVVDEFLQTEDITFLPSATARNFRTLSPADACAWNPCRTPPIKHNASRKQSPAGQLIIIRCPWFWTDQYDIKLQMAGISAGHDRVVTRGNAEERKLSVFYFRNGKLIAMDSINRPVDHMIGRKLIASGASLTPEECADETLDLKRIPTDPYVH